MDDGEEAATVDPFADSRAEADRLMREAGWHPLPDWGGAYARDNLIAGIQPDEQALHVKDWTKITLGHLHYGADTPDTPAEAAAWLVAKFSNGAPLKAQRYRFRRKSGATQEGSNAGADSAFAVRADANASDAIAADEPVDSGASEDGSSEAGVSDLSVYGGFEAELAIDATFGELEGEDHLNLPELPPLADEGPELERPAGGVAYFGDNIDVIRMAKLGRLGQIARALNATLQEGWTVEEFASLQNKIIRIDQGLDPDDPEARARFHAINERSAAMGRVDAYKRQREGELEALGREQRAEIEAFDTEAGWPE